MVITKKIFFFILCVIFFACKKDTNVDSPTVQITAPSGLQTFNVFDTIYIQGHASDGQGLKSVTITLTTGQSSTDLPAVSVPVTSNSMTFNWPFILSDIHLASGQYYITVTASNGTNSSYAYQKIYVDAAPTKRLAVYAITRNSGGVRAWELDSVFHVSSGVLVTGNFIASDVSSYYQQLYIAPSDTGNVNAISVPVNAPAWNIQGLYSTAPVFTNIYSYNDAAYVSVYTGGYVKYYDHRGVQKMLVTTDPGYYPIKTYVWSNYIFVEEKNISSPTENLVLYNSQSGVGYQQYLLPGPVVAMYGMDNNDVFIFGNQTSGAPYIEEYSISGNIFYSPISLPGAKLLSVAQINAGEFLIGFNNGNIYQYTYNPSNFLTYISGVNASHIRYDAINNQVVIASGNLVKEYNCGISSATPTYSATMADSVLDIQILFNK